MSVSAARSGGRRQLARRKALYYGANGGQSGTVNNAIVADARCEDWNGRKAGEGVGMEESLWFELRLVHAVFMGPGRIKNSAKFP